MKALDVIEIVCLLFIAVGAYLAGGWAAALLLVGAIGLVLAFIARMRSPRRPEPDKGSR